MNANGDLLDNDDYTVYIDYDANGNMISKTTDHVDPANTDETWSYSYDQDDRMVAASDGTDTWGYSYDPFGRRVLKTSASGAEFCFYDGVSVIKETDGSGAALQGYVMGPAIDDYVAQVSQAAGTGYYYEDGLGSITALGDQSGLNKLASYQYDPFGKASVTLGGAVEQSNPYGYTGRPLDSETGLMYYRSRYYDYEQRRFAEEDRWDGIISYPNTYVIKYSYVENNPLNYNDPFGHGFYVGPAYPDVPPTECELDRVCYDNCLRNSYIPTIGGLGLGAGLTAGTAQITAAYTTGTTATVAGGIAAGAGVGAWGAGVYTGAGHGICYLKCVKCTPTPICNK